ncbi:unnamed protein product, partial [Rotaria sp. Silwood1]
MLNYPHITPLLHQHPMPMVHNQLNHQLSSTNSTYSSSNNNIIHHDHNTSNQQQTNQFQSQIIAVPMESENDDNFITVSRRKKRAKMDHVQFRTPFSTTSTISTTNTDCSTSSTNTSSITTNVLPANNLHLQTNSSKTNGLYTRFNTKEISQEARRFAVTRYPFPPFVIKFKQDVDEKTVIKNILNHFSAIYKVKIVLAGHRLKNKRELLMFVENQYEKIRPSHLPAQFSIILRNVPIEKNIDSLLNDIKNDYPNVINAFRLSNKNQIPTTIVRLDISCVKTIEDLLSKKFIYINNVRLPVTEYLAPAKVLICSKCFQIGHFRSTCKSVLEYCKICGKGVDDVKHHIDVCDSKRCCVRCSGDHDSNDHRCPDIKSYRAMLTKSLLTSTGPPNHHQNNSTNYWFNDQDFPLLSSNRGHYDRSSDA